MLELLEDQMGIKIHRNTVIVFCADIVLVSLSYCLANLLRLNFSINRDMLKVMLELLPAVVAIKLLCLFYFDLYRGMWRYTSLNDLVNLFKACTVSSLLIVAWAAFVHRFVSVSRSVFIIDWCLTFLLIGGFRVGVRFYFETFSNRSCKESLILLKEILKKKNRGDGKNLVIIGAGSCGEKIYREIRDNAHVSYNVIGFLDDNPVKLHKKIHGIPVIGTIPQLPDIVQDLGVEEVLIAIPSASSDEMRRIVEVCKESGVKFKTVPRMDEILNGRLSLNSIREVSYRDLLDREVINLDRDSIGQYLEGKTVLVTGAAGSIGSELCRQICLFDPRRLLLYEIAESPLYEVDLEFKKRFPGTDIIPILADVRDKRQLCHIFEKYSPEIVFHAAAYKHVPMLEIHPWKAVENNVLGTLNVAETARKFEAECFVLVSTDKAVRPTSVMGASKRVSEMIIQCNSMEPGCKTKFVSVRFGNVIGSIGSVVPLFKRQIREGGPVTVTHREVTRYFMTIPEACQLILQAGAMGNGGETYIFDMGKPVKIDHMARELIRLAGLVPDRDIKIEYIGLRPGEKLFEELVVDGEDFVPSSHEKILVLKGNGLDRERFGALMEELMGLIHTYDAGKIKAKLSEIVRGYNPF